QVSVAVGLRRNCVTMVSKRWFWNGGEMYSISKIILPPLNILGIFPIEDRFLFKFAKKIRLCPDAMFLAKPPSIFLLRTRNTLISRKSHSIGSGVIRLGENRFCGRVKSNVGANMTLKDQPGMALQSIGQSVMKILLHGTVM